MKVQIINGPNLNLLGKRETEIYGNSNFESLFQDLIKQFDTFKLSYFQSNHEGEIIDKIHEVGFDFDAIILNAGALTHTSIALGDAVKAIDAKVIEVHISNVYKRESFRQQSYISANSNGIIVGFGLKGYRLALQSLL